MYCRDTKLSQYQFCHAYADGADQFCSKLEGLPDWTRDFSTESYPNASSIQLAIMQDIGHALLTTDIQVASSSVKASGLQDNFGIITELPVDQWVTEVVGWEATLWASLQVEFADYAIGRASRNREVAAFVKTNLTIGEKAFCGKQKMGNPGGFVYVTPTLHRKSTHNVLMILKATSMFSRCPSSGRLRSWSHCSISSSSDSLSCREDPHE